MRPLLVIEDGGYVIPRLHTRYPEYLDYFLGAVEQTANGIWAYRDNVPEAERRITNVNVAESELKKNSESPLIGDAVYMNVSRLLDNARVSARDREVLVVGFGATGSRVAESFKNNGAHVTVYDEKPQRREEARANGYNVANDLDEGIKNKFLVVGCTGKVSIGISPLLRADHRTFFVNASSKRLEVNHAELQNVTSSTESVPGITTYHLVNDKDLLILADGFPVNFFDRSESVPDKELQFIYGLIFSAAVHLVKNPSLPADIVEVPKELQDYVESMHRLTR